MSAISNYIRFLLFSKSSSIKCSSVRQFTSSSIIKSKKFDMTPYPWKNHDYQNPKFQYTSKIEDSDLTKENKQALFEKRLDLSLALNSERQQILKESEWPRYEYTPYKTQRCGLIAYKIGIIPHWTKKGKRIIVTLYQVLDNVALNYIPPKEVENMFNTQRYYMKFNADYPAWVTQKRWGLQFVGAMTGDPGEFNAAYSGLFTKYGVTPRRKLARFLVSEDAVIEPGTELSIQHYRIGDHIDITARSSNLGFQGVMKRYKFAGGPDSHGTTKNHRRPGAIGGGQKVLRGKKLPGVMGNRLRTTRGIEIIRMDYKYNILYLNGITPGPIHSYAHVCDTWLKYRIEGRTKPPAMPTIYETDEEWIDWTTREDDDFVDYIQKFDEPSLIY